MIRVSKSQNRDKLISPFPLRGSGIKSSEEVVIPVSPIKSRIKRESIVSSAHYSWILVFTGMSLQLFYIIGLMASLLSKERGFIRSEVIKTAILSLLLGLMTLTGCMVGPNYKQPQTRLPERFANETGRSFSTNNVETLWWRGFNDEKLNQLIELAIMGNYDLRIATANLREARALRSEARFDLYPTMTSQASYTRERLSTRVPPVSSDRDINLYDAGFDATWEIDFFGRVRRSVEASTAEVRAAEANRQDVVVSILAEVARNYFELRGAQNQLEVARRNAENQKQTLDLTIALLEGGRGTELDTSRARAQLNSTLATIPPLETIIKRTIYRLSVLTGQQPAALESELSKPLPLPNLPNLVALGSPKELLRRRSDIRVAEHNLAAATARIGVATADLFPRITLIGSIALEADSFAGLFKGGSNMFFFGPQIFWAAFDLGRVRARIKAAGARAEAALAQYEQTILLALEETENALVDFSRQQERRNFLRESAQASERAMELAQLRYRYGVADFLTVLDAERTLLQAQDQLAQSETNTATALIAVYKALGGGWEVEKENQYENKLSDKTE